MKSSQRMVNDLPDDWGNNTTTSTMSELRRIIRDRGWEKGHIVLEGDSFEINGPEDFPTLQSDNEQRPIVIKAKNIGGATIKGRGVYFEDEILRRIFLLAV